jgi:hypothetical protein
MATLNEHAYNIRNIIRANQGNSDDERLNIKQIKFWISSYRAKGVFDITEYGKQIDPQLVQDLGVLKLKEVDKADSECPKVDWGCKIKYVDIPKLVDLPHNRALVFVGLIDKQTPIIIDYADVHIFKRATKFGNRFNRAYFINNRLYIVHREEDNSLRYINFRGVFERPEEVTVYDKDNPKGRKFNDAVDEYPMPMRLYEYVLTKILTNEFQVSMQTVNDELNNARQDNEKLRP